MISAIGEVVTGKLLWAALRVGGLFVGVSVSLFVLLHSTVRLRRVILEIIDQRVENSIYVQTADSLTKTETASERALRRKMIGLLAACLLLRLSR